ncbi:TonB-dependent receptor [Kaustia mangrovi]|uniref:TonB-dependent receptor n=1 Tax=Kaustia mangrovi TaxID=2593653 RepID=A0A7S8HBP0_9HYPH|nr:TonB-dependent receptor [Kaustia mangrovi]QPC42403.1 TonB-dependent receptor [Kaustia mangrovi]
MGRRAGAARVGIIATGAGKRTRHPAAVLLASAALCCAGIASSTTGYAQPASPAAPSGGSIGFSIPAQPLSSALDTFIRTTGWQISYPSALARGRRSSAVVGTMAPAQALQRLVAGTGLEVRIGAAGSAALVDPGSLPATISDNGSTVLDAITVSSGPGDVLADTPYETPGSTAYISAEQIERVPPSSPGDMFDLTPGVIASGNRVGPSMNLNIRGMQGQDRVNVMVDGTRQSNNSYRGYQGSRNEVYVDPDFLGGIEITEGPLGGAGGIGAMGGVVNMRTIEAGDIVRDGETYGVRIKGGLADNSISPPEAGTREIRERDWEDTLAEAWSGNIVAATTQENYDLLFGFSRRKNGNYFAGRNGRETYVDTRPRTPRETKFSPFGPGGEVLGTSQDVTSFIAKGALRWGDGHELELGYILYNNEYGELNETLLAFSVGSGIVIPVAQPEIQETTTHTLRARYSYDPSGNDLIGLKANLWGTDVDTETHGQDFERSVRTYGGDISNRALIDTTFGRFSVTTGAETVFEHAKADNAGVDNDLISPLSEPKGRRTMVGGFGEAQWEMTRWLTLEGNLRYDYYRADPDNSDFPNKKGGRLSPSSSITITPYEGLQIFGAYTEGWRPPSLRETSAGLENGYLVPNPDLDPETSRNFEFGVNLLRNDVFLDGDNLRFKAVRFSNNYEDYIARARLPFAGARYTWVNIDRAKFRGYELSAAYDAGFAFVEAGFTKYDKVEFCQSGVCSLDGIGTDYGIQNMPPKYSGHVTAGVRLLDRRLTLGGQAYYFGKRYGGYDQAPGAFVLPVYYTANAIFDIFAGYEINQNARLDFSIENLTDRYYLDPLSTGVVPSPGRTARLSFTARF